MHEVSKQYVLLSLTCIRDCVIAGRFMTTDGHFAELRRSPELLEDEVDSSSSSSSTSNASAVTARAAGTTLLIRLVEDTDDEGGTSSPVNAISSPGCNFGCSCWHIQEVGMGPPAELRRPSPLLADEPADGGISRTSPLNGMRTKSGDIFFHLLRQYWCALVQTSPHVPSAHNDQCYVRGHEHVCDR